MYRILGREPAAIVGLIEAALAVVVAVGLSISNEQVGLIMAAVTAALGLVVAWRTHQTTLGVVVGLSKAVLALAIGFGLHLSPELTGSLIALITVGFGFFNRTQATPVAPPAVAGP